VKPEIPALAFAQAARVIRARLHAEGLPAPAFRSPPRTDATRTISRHPGGAVVAVRIRDREPLEWVADMVEGALRAAGRPPGDGLSFRIIEETCAAIGVDVDAAILAPPGPHEEVPY